MFDLAAYTLVASTPPEFVSPCSPVGATKPPTGPDWVHELKLDGYRFQIIKDGRVIRLYSGDGTEWTKRLPIFADMFRRLPCRSANLDGVVVLPDSDGAPFPGLHETVRSAADQDLTYFAFDLLYRDGTDLRPLPLIERKLRLARLVARADIRCMHLVQTFHDGAALLAAAEKHHFRAILSKRRSAPYRSGECGHWRKIKTPAWRGCER